MNPKALAGFLLELMDTASGPYTEAGLERAQATRSMLKAIQSGDFVIVTQAKESSTPVPPGAEP